MYSSLTQKYFQNSETVRRTNLLLSLIHFPYTCCTIFLFGIQISFHSKVYPGWSKLGSYPQLGAGKPKNICILAISITVKVKRVRKRAANR